MSINEHIFDKFPILESKRLLFRNFTKNDAQNIFLIRSDIRVMKFMNSTIPQTIQDSEEKIFEIKKAFKEQKAITWVIIDKSTDTLIGDFSFWRLDKQNCRGEIGYALSPDYWRKGLMTETMNTLICFGFEKMNLHSIEANTNPKNEKSQQLLEKYGFKKEAHFRENYFYGGKFLDSIIYSLLKSDVE